MTDHKTMIIRFEPLIPTIKDEYNVGERIFVSEFQKLMGGKTHKIYYNGEKPQDYDYNDIAVGLEPFQSMMGITYVTPRQAQIATSMMRWFGSQNGNRFLEDALQLRAELGTRYTDKEVMAMAWAREKVSNEQTEWHLCKEEVPSAQQQLLYGTRATRSLDDVETMNRTMIWLGSQQGMAFVQDCSRRRTRALKIMRTKKHMATNANIISRGHQPIPLPDQIRKQLKKRRVAAPAA